MNVGITGLKKEFVQHRKVARRNNPAAIPIINELEIVALQRARGKITPSKARSKIKACCMKAGVNPMSVDAGAMQPQFDFNPYKKGKQKNLSIKPVNLFTKKNNNPRARRRALSIPSLFPASAPKKKDKYPGLTLKPMKKTKKKTTFEIKPINFMKAPKRKTSRSKKGLNIKPMKPFKFGGFK